MAMKSYTADELIDDITATTAKVMNTRPGKSMPIETIAEGIWVSSNHKIPRSKCALYAAAVARRLVDQGLPVTIGNERRPFKGSSLSVVK